MQTAANVAQSKMGAIPTVIHPEYKTRPDGSTMKALAWFGTRDVRLIDAPIPDISEPDDVILKVTGTTICGSDLHLFNGEVVALQKGDILGHEFMGIVDRIGPEVRNLKIGQRVVASFQIACGECEYCEKKKKKKISSFCDRTNHSTLQNAMYGHRDAGFFGYSHFTGGFPGGQAEYVRVPKGNVNLLPIPDEVPDEKALYLSDVLCTAYHCVMDTGVNEGDVVGVWTTFVPKHDFRGWVPSACAWRSSPNSRVPSASFASTASPERLEKAEELGFETIDFSKHSDVVKRFQEIAPGGLDVALDCGTFHQAKTFIHKVDKALMLETDVSEIANEMIVSTKKGGRCGVIAAYVGYTNHFNIGALMEKGIRFIGNGQAPVHKWLNEILYDLIIPGKFDPTFMVSHRVPIDDFPKLYHAFDRRVGGVEKVFVETKFSSPPSPGCPRTSRVDEWAVV
ncbi:GroES-like protein [Ganoderma leucocontextum]|nr:GroES-like protein [Ganoderma leucocontextum]